MKVRNKWKERKQCKKKKTEEEERAFPARKMFQKIIADTTNVNILKIKIYSQGYTKRLKL